MNNTFLESLKTQTNFTTTDNGATAHKSTLNKVYDMFSFGGAYRGRSDMDIILLFKNALEEDETLALKCLFYLRDIRGGQGEREFFRICMKWLAIEHPEMAIRNISNFVEYGRWDDLYCLVDTPVEKEMFSFMKEQFYTDIDCLTISDSQGISLLGKWLKSENASSEETKKLAIKTMKAFGLTPKKYRKTLSALRSRINIVEKLMSEGRWDEIEFDKIPSKAGLIYRNAFAHNDITAIKYQNFVENKEVKVNAGALYPYEIVQKVTKKYWDWNDLYYNTPERLALSKYWENQIDYLEGKKSDMMCIVDTSGSMERGYGNIAPIDVAISLGMYCAERVGGPFKNHYISFSSKPQLISIEGVDFVDKVCRIYQTNLCDNTNLKAVFDLLKDSLNHGATVEDLPKTLVVISDMEIDFMSYWKSKAQVKTEMEALREEWASEGLALPHLVYWNVNALKNIILDDDVNTTYVSGCSPVIFKSILTGKTGYQLCLDTITSDRYKLVG